MGGDVAEPAGVPESGVGPHAASVTTERNSGARPRGRKNEIMER